MHDDFGIAIRLENGAAVFEFATPLSGVRQISVVANSELSFAAINYDRLRVRERGVAGSGIARVADGGIAGKRCETLRIENVLHQTHAFDDVKVGAIGGTNSGGFLSAMLQRIKSQIAEFRGLRISERAENSTVIVEVIVIELELLCHVRRIASFDDSSNVSRAVLDISQSSAKNQSASAVSGNHFISA
jgi:hypothetical protein